MENFAKQVRQSGNEYAANYIEQLESELAEARAIVEQSHQLFVALKRSLDETHNPQRYTILRTDADSILTKAAAIAAAEGKTT